MATLFFILFLLAVTGFGFYTGKLRRRVCRLAKDVGYQREISDRWYKYLMESYTKQDNLKLELDEAQEGLERTTIAYSDSKSLNQALQDENKDLIRTLDLYKDVLDCLRINVGHVTYSPEKKAKK